MPVERMLSRGQGCETCSKLRGNRTSPWPSAAQHQARLTPLKGLEPGHHCRLHVS